jgi:hypothetical protein
MRISVGKVAFVHIIWIWYVYNMRTTYYTMNNSSSVIIVIVL